MSTTKTLKHFAFALAMVTVAGCQEHAAGGRPRLMVVEAAELEKAAETIGGRRIFYVSPDGREDNSGTSASSSWPLAYVLAHPKRIEPGDLIYMLDGVYGDGTKAFESQLTGEPGNPIVLRAAPGARPRIHGSLIVRGGFAWYWGFEVFGNSEDRTGTQDGPTSGFLEGVLVFGPNTKFINMVVHDTVQGFSFWMPASDSEIYGCLIYHNGYAGPSRGHGHGIYTQNENGWKMIRDNIIFNQFGLGIQAYGSDKAIVRGYVIEGNILVNNGILYGKSRPDNLLLANSNGLERIRVRKNHSYNTPSDASGYSRIGWNDNAPNKDAIVADNYFIGGYIALEMWNWQNLAAYRNTAYVTDGFTTIVTRPTTGETTYEVDNNTYYGTPLFRLNNQNRTWDQWRNEGLDKNSKLSGTAPQANWVFVRPNRFERGRANIVIYNWENLDTVTVDLGRLARPGVGYRVRDAQNYFGDPVVSDAFPTSGTTINIPMKGLTTVSAPAGKVSNPPVHTAPRFGTFILEVDKN